MSQIYIVPTYECNLSCKNCYSKKYLLQFPDYLSWEGFIGIYEFFKRQTNSISFIGGEPTKWKFINEAILFLRNKNKKVTLFSNGSIIPSVMPDNLILNGNNLFDSDLGSNILANLEIYKNNNVKIRLRFNIDELFTDNRIKEAIKFTKQYANSVSLSILFPTNYDKKIGQSVFNLSSGIIAESISVKISRATPLCLFTEEQRKYLKDKCKLKGQCSLPSDSIVVHPDGNMIQPCIELPKIKHLNDLRTLSPKDLFSKEIKRLRNIENKICNGCEFFKSKECCGGCLAYK